MKTVKMIALFAMIFNLYGCAPAEPFILDGPGMVYVDSDYRTDYANVLPYDDDHEAHISEYFAVAYLGDGDEGKENRSIYINRLFGDKLPEDMLEKIEHFDFGGDSMYLVIPRYNQHIDIIPNEEANEAAYETKVLLDGDAFTINCGNVKIFMNSHGGQELLLNANDENKVPDDCIWDISDLDKILTD